MVMRKGDLGRERRTILAMVRIHCSGHHQCDGRGSSEVCDDCCELLDYAFERLDWCKFGADKPVCSKCSVNCYKPEMRERVRAVMRYAGPRMFLRHPVMALRHLFRGKS